MFPFIKGKHNYQLTGNMLPKGVCCMKAIWNDCIHAAKSRHGEIQKRKILIDKTMILTSS